MTRYRWVFLGIILLTICLRYFNYNNRWGLAYDQAHDALVAREALARPAIPLLGPFSSAGPFQTGGEWYWLIMIGTAVFPQHVMTPWIVLTALSVLMVIIMMISATKLLDKRFGLFVGVFTAVSTAQLAQGTNLTNQTPLSFFSLCALLSAIFFLRTKRAHFLFLLGLFVSFAATIHLQGVSLMCLVLLTIFFAGKSSIRALPALFLGLLLPILPLLWFDLHHHWVNSGHMLQYYLVDQHRISYDQLGRRWITYLGVYWPKEWAHIIGGNVWVVYLIFLSSCVGFINILIQHKIRREWFVLFLTTIVMIVLLRYIRTPLYSSYLVFLHPFILLLTTIDVYLWMKNEKTKVFGILLMVVIIVSSIYSSINTIFHSENVTAQIAQIWQTKLVQTFPDQKFTVYDFRYKTVDKSVPLSLFLDASGQSGPNSIPIGIGIATYSGVFGRPVLVGDDTGYQIVDLRASSSADLEREGWIPVTRQSIYTATQDWMQ